VLLLLQVGTVLDDPLDFYGGRLSQGQRKASMTDQLLADRELEVSRKKRYNKLQVRQGQGLWWWWTSSST
jgi:hypothetical protein